jgi:hypothetical protein
MRCLILVLVRYSNGLAQEDTMTAQITHSVGRLAEMHVGCLRLSSTAMVLL